MLQYFRGIKEDLECILDRDPAATSKLQIWLFYPGFKAIKMYRKAHWFYTHHMVFAARCIAFHCQEKTQIDIHPAAKIGRRVFIDHGTGVIIGETAEVGDDVTIHQDVTLGGTGKEIGKRHPTVGNGVMIGAGAKILGAVKIGDNSKIAAGSIVLHEIPENCTAVGIPARVVRRDGKRVDYYDQVNIPDPVQHEIDSLRAEIEELKAQLRIAKGEQE
ncbi:MAG: serine O-acetyltransferase [Clostridia bacterium]|nr:serine O-acetyltransferase [Clostridia bacterium]MBR0509935.1 serine O-acetyltransferase [Clostridia bacterium]MBR0538478.1 serine O-acetyltransferase [Clostridia bacterium]